MAGKALTEAQVKELLTNGRTGTIRGFKSKTGKKFDARVALNKQEDGQITGLKFDFDDLEPQKVKDVKCPLCGGDIVVTPFGFGCSNYKKDAEDSVHLKPVLKSSLWENVQKTVPFHQDIPALHS